MCSDDLILRLASRLPFQHMDDTDLLKELEGVIDGSLADMLGFGFFDYLTGHKRLRQGAHYLEDSFPFHSMPQFLLPDISVKQFERSFI